MWHTWLGHLYTLTFDSLHQVVLLSRDFKVRDDYWQCGQMLGFELCHVLEGANGYSCEGLKEEKGREWGVKGGEGKREGSEEEREVKQEHVPSSSLTPNLFWYPFPSERRVNGADLISQWLDHRCRYPLLKLMIIFTGYGDSYTYTHTK